MCHRGLCRRCCPFKHLIFIFRAARPERPSPGNARSETVGATEPKNTERLGGIPVVKVLFFFFFLQCWTVFYSVEVSPCCGRFVPETSAFRQGRGFGIDPLKETLSFRRDVRGRLQGLSSARVQGRVLQDGRPLRPRSAAFVPQIDDESGEDAASRPCLLTWPFLSRPRRMDKVRAADAGAHQQPQHPAAAGAHQQTRGQPQAVPTGGGELQHARKRLKTVAGGKKKDFLSLLASG